MRTSRFIGKGAGLDGEHADQCVAQPLGGRPGGSIKVDMSVITFDWGHCVSSSCGSVLAQRWGFARSLAAFGQPFGNLAIGPNFRHNRDFN
jgi:hypothetical protein